jgi:NAD(P)-dependent dehydrogenase (short-subunit alcohol dehydrogenase family)
MMLRSRALGRFGRVEDVSYPCIFLASEAAAWMSGSTIVIDGGNIRAAEIVQMGL